MFLVEIAESSKGKKRKDTNYDLGSLLDLRAETERVESLNYFARQERKKNSRSNWKCKVFDIKIIFQTQLPHIEMASEWIIGEDRERVGKMWNTCAEGEKYFNFNFRVESAPRRKWQEGLVLVEI